MSLSSITGKQIRAARELLGLSGTQLAKDAKVGRSTVWRIETDKPAFHDKFIAVQKCLESRGIRFTETGVELAQ